MICTASCTTCGWKTSPSENSLDIRMPWISGQETHRRSTCKNKNSSNHKQQQQPRTLLSTTKENQKMTFRCFDTKNKNFFGLIQIWYLLLKFTRQCFACPLFTFSVNLICHILDLNRVCILFIFYFFINFLIFKVLFSLLLINNLIIVHFRLD